MNFHKNDNDKLEKEIRKEQLKLDLGIIEKQEKKIFSYSSYENSKRLKLSLLVEVGEFVKELPTFFKLWKRPQNKLEEAKEELMDCLGFFISIINIYQFDFNFSEIYKKSEENRNFSDLLSDFFLNSSLIYLPSNEDYDYEKKFFLVDKDFSSSYELWLENFFSIAKYLSIDEEEIYNLFLKKNKINQEILRKY